MAPASGGLDFLVSFGEPFIERNDLGFLCGSLDVSRSESFIKRNDLSFQRGSFDLF